MTTVNSAKIAALADWLGENIENITTTNDGALTVGKQQYLVLTDEEADEACKEYIRESLWAFNADFILSACDLPCELENALASFQAAKCESANDAVLALVKKCCGLDAFVKEAIAADGRGHFLSTYDGDEVEADGFYIYRIA